jgi:transcriptional regulator GlxA family with amidase domain
MSQHHFCELFRSSIGVSPYQYVIGQRVEPESKCSEPPIRASS